MINIISFIALLLCSWALIIVNCKLLKDNKSLIDLCFKYKQVLNIKYGIAADDTKIIDINLIYGLLKKAESEGYVIDETEISCIYWFDDFIEMKKLKGEAEIFDDVYFIEHEEYILIEYESDYFVIELDL